jgi:hypothetical protein
MLPVKVTLTSFFSSYFWGLTDSFFGYGFGVSGVFAMSAFDVVLVRDLSYLASFLEDLEAFISMLSDVLTFF